MFLFPITIFFHHTETQEKLHSVSFVRRFWRFFCILPQDKIFKVLKPDWNSLRNSQLFRGMKDIMMEYEIQFKKDEIFLNSLRIDEYIK